MSGSELAGRHALVAGAAEGLGRALATGLAAAGADVSVTTRRDDVAEEVTANSILNECWSYGREGRALRLDLTDLDAVSAAFAQLERELAPIDVLVSLAFEAPPAPGPDAAPGDWSAVIEAGAAHVFVLARAVGPSMIARRSGLIAAVLPPEPPEAADAPLRAARAAVVGLCEGLAAEWAESGVAVEWLDEAAPQYLLARLQPPGADGATS